jgi:tetratricopeptide repeat protein
LQGKYVEAGPLHKRSLAIFEKALADDPPNLLTTLTNYADLLRKTGRGEDAAKLESRAAEI